MATVTNWIDHLSAKEVVGAVYPGAGSSETLLVILGIFLDWLANCERFKNGSLESI